nr:hypothetical protein [Tanacetum cinerariifolium]GFB93089.1 hypothetical protein [Tanacetum cinerariifolium]
DAALGFQNGIGADRFIAIGRVRPQTAHARFAFSLVQSADQQRRPVHANGKDHVPEYILQAGNVRLWRLVAGHPDAHARLQDEPARTDGDQPDDQCGKKGRRVRPLHAPDPQQYGRKHHADGVMHEPANRQFAMDNRRVADAVAVPESSLGHSGEPAADEVPGRGRQPQDSLEQQRPEIEQCRAAHANENCQKDEFKHVCPCRWSTGLCWPDTLAELSGKRH